MKLVVFGLSVSSSWGNGHATTYRALLSAFAARGHEIRFYEWDAPWYGGGNRDLADPAFCDLVLYDRWSDIARRAVADAAGADAVLVGSYVHEGARLIDDLLEGGCERLFFYDIDTPVTVSKLRNGGAEYLRADQVPRFHAYLSFTGGPFLREVLEGELGAREARALYCSVDPERYRRTAVDPALAADIAYMGTYAPDRQPVIDQLLIAVARRLPERRFVVAGPQYPADIDWPANVRLIPHLPPDRHPAFYSSSAWQLNATRSDMVAAGWSPSVRLFEAGAVGAAVISDSWPGLDQIFKPGAEIALPGSTDEVVEILSTTSDEDRLAMGRALRERVLSEHSSERRARELEHFLSAPAAAISVP